jgi:hypothetical protein
MCYDFLLPERDEEWGRLLQICNYQEVLFLDALPFGNLIT